MKKELDEFLKEMAKAPLLDRVEERKLLKAVQQKGTDCDEMRKLIECSGRHIISVANQYQDLGLSLMELIDEARKGLVKAAVKYDIKSDFSFISYAVWWMRQSIIQALE